MHCYQILTIHTNPDLITLLAPAHCLAGFKLLQRVSPNDLYNGEKQLFNRTLRGRKNSNQGQPKVLWIQPLNQTKVSNFVIADLKKILNITCKKSQSNLLVNQASLYHTFQTVGILSINENLSNFNGGNNSKKSFKQESFVWTLPLPYWLQSMFIVYYLGFS